jgi:hypothetical protein
MIRFITMELLIPSRLEWRLPADRLECSSTLNAVGTIRTSASRSYGPISPNAGNYFELIQYKKQ